MPNCEHSYDSDVTTDLWLENIELLIFMATESMMTHILNVEAVNARDLIRKRDVLSGNLNRNI